jgi:hypothetical protein
VRRQNVGKTSARAAALRTTDSLLQRKRDPMLVTDADSLAVTLAVRAALASSSSCVPPGAVLMSMAGGTQADALRPLQFARVRSLQCLLHRVVSLCWGNYTDAFGTCVHPQNPLPPPGEAAYHEITWSKWTVLEAALRAARVALFVDADVLLVCFWERARRASQRPPLSASNQKAPAV